MKKVRFLGLDVYAEAIAVAIAEPDGEARSLGLCDQGEALASRDSRPNSTLLTGRLSVFSHRLVPKASGSFRSTGAFVAAKCARRTLSASSNPPKTCRAL
jgi:hypothetical protein